MGLSHGLKKGKNEGKLDNVEGKGQRQELNGTIGGGKYVCFGRRGGKVPRIGQEYQVVHNGDAS